MAEHAFFWFVYKDYVVVEDDGKEPYFEATSVPKDIHEALKALKESVPKGGQVIHIKEGSITWPRTRKPFAPIEPFGKEYAPIIDTPHLFLDFARLYERRNPEQQVRDWIMKYGLLGLHRPDSPRLEMGKAGVSLGEMHPTEYSKRGGEQETLARVLSEARQANRLLSAYEAVLSTDVEKLEQIALEEEFEVPLDDVSEEVVSETAQELNSYLQIKAVEARATYVDALIDWILSSYLLGNVHQRLREFAFPCVAHRRSIYGHYLGNPKANMLWGPDSLVRSLEPRNLLGAMYLQFYWLITSAAELSRCKHCSRIIPYVVPMPGSGKKRKTYKNKEFCDDRCRQNYHYQNRVKPARQGKRRH